MTVTIQTSPISLEHRPWKVAGRLDRGKFILTWWGCIMLATFAITLGHTLGALFGSELLQKDAALFFSDTNGMGTYTLIKYGAVSLLLGMSLLPLCFMMFVIHGIASAGAFAHGHILSGAINLLTCLLLLSAFLAFNFATTKRLKDIGGKGLKASLLFHYIIGLIPLVGTIVFWFYLVLQPRKDSSTEK